MKMVGTLSLCLILIVFVVGLISGRDLEKPGDYWLRMTKSERVNYLVGYVHGVDTIITGGEDHKGTVIEDLLYSSQKLRKSIIRRTTELYRKKANRGIFWNHMLFLSCMELEGESKDIIEERLVIFRALSESYYGKNYDRPGRFWLQLPQRDRSMYLEGLIEGLRTGTVLKRHEDTRAIDLYGGIFSMSAEIGTIADIVTDFYKDPSNKIIDYRFLFPLAFLKFNKAEESVIRQHLEELRNTEKHRRLQKESGSAQPVWWMSEYPDLIKVVSAADNASLASSYRTGPGGKSRVNLSIYKKPKGGLILKLKAPKGAMFTTDPKTGEKIPSKVAPVLTIRDHNLDGIPDDFNIEPSGVPLYEEEFTKDGFIKFRDSPDHQSILVQWIVGIGFLVNHFLHKIDSALPRR